MYPALVPPARKEVMTASRALKAVQVPLDAQACLVKVTALRGCRVFPGVVPGERSSQGSPRAAQTLPEVSPPE